MLEDLVVDVIFLVWCSIGLTCFLFFVDYTRLQFVEGGLDNHELLFDIYKLPGLASILDGLSQLVSKRLNLLLQNLVLLIQVLELLEGDLVLLDQALLSCVFCLEFRDQDFFVLDQLFEFLVLLESN